ncbi:MAG: glycoside hydrolase family 127 protein, partial [Abditibacteriota bacterium]|nr:glycoside hydrolase family 127 protein [Abditibacteriota bacterium]
WQIDIESDYPFDPRVRLRIKCIDARRDYMYFRIPVWSEHTRFVIDGEERQVQAGAYHREKRDWSRGVTVDIDFDFSLWQWTGAKEKEGLTSLYRGPVLLAYDDRFNTVRAEEAASLTIDPGEPELLPEGRLAFASDRGPAVLTDFARAGSAGTKYATWLRTARPVRDIASRLRGI